MIRSDYQVFVEFTSSEAQGSWITSWPTYDLRRTFGVMNEDRNREAKRADLLREKAALQENILTAQRRLEMVEFGLRVLDDDLFASRPSVSPLTFTPNGMIKNLPDRIVELLKTQGRVLSITQMAELWFSFSMKMTMDELREL